jgi:LmbE family N-acetylglucosaminyl deacetylase
MNTKLIVSGLLSALLWSFSAAARVPEGDLLEGLDPGPDGMIDILTVFAHQDDETIVEGGTLLKMKQDPRVRLHILCLTLGDMSEAKDRLKITPEHLGRIRSEELETAAAVYQAEQVIQFQYHDQGLESADQEKLTTEILEVIEDVGAEMVLTHDPLGITRHPDHITCSQVATEAFKRSSAKRLYYTTLPASMYRLILLFTPFKGQAERAVPTLRVNIKEFKKLKRMAFYAHASQKHFSLVGPTAEFRILMNYEYFTLAGSKQ